MQMYDNDADTIAEAILAGGPVTASFDVYDDFENCQQPAAPPFAPLKPSPVHLAHSEGAAAARDAIEWGVRVLTPDRAPRTPVRARPCRDDMQEG